MVEKEGFSGYWDHGGRLPDSSRPKRDILDASTTINPFGPPFPLEGLLKGVGEGWFSYPDPWADRLNNLIARRVEVPAGCVVSGPGATSLIYRWMETVRPGRLVLFDPVFSEYPRAAAFYKVPVFRVQGRLPLPFSGKSPASAKEWGIDPESFDPMPGDWAVLVNPVNPTGQILSMDQIRYFFDMFSRVGAGLLVDESFQDFVENRSSLLGAVAPDNPFLSVVRSVTKVTGLPGIRTGWLAGSGETILKIRQSLGPWAVGAIEAGVMEQYYGLSGWSFGRIGEARERLSNFLSSSGWAVAKSSAPFLFVHTGWGEKAPLVREKLFREQGVFLRIAEGFGPRSGSDYIRLGYQAFSKPQIIEEVFSNQIRIF